jgi:hypothetical protein
MGKLLTAEEFLIINDDKDFRLPMSGRYVSEMMVAFAKVHVAQALEARDRLYQEYYKEEIKWTEDNIEFVKNSYPLTNIK